IRPAGVADFTAVYKMNERLLGSVIPKSIAETVYRSAITDAAQTVLVIMHSGNAVGYIHARQVADLLGAMHTEIVSIAVYDYYINRSAYTELVNAVLKWSAQMLSSSVRICGGLKEQLLDIGFCENGCLEKNIMVERKDHYERMYT
ncbi:MAG: hypothetical protein HDT43_04595, partial [Ruminococcaceae bacterium]|nr:hypothetical protein [Oscillospiraceae bacterium]